MTTLDGLTARDVIALLALEAHPEGGFYRETFRDAAVSATGRAASTAIYFLLPAGVRSRWHRVDAAEIWHFYAGAPLDLFIVENGERTAHRLGADLRAGERPQAIVRAHCWQAAQSRGDWTLVGCTVAPGFEFAHFEIADGEPDLG
ncbi:MAG: cupin domain-containing protein [Hyphomicrobiales bacterium]|nr:cupin domain-containing protein [Hyphomicrobiales bacterium]